ncbi:hypothetical protein [Caballeronia sp. LZ035]|uniref:hypothetical protein n=1 Tax=Caballeronia sp. LZ035 TaxID=3038568 RepID=UPI002867303A|nr:hypothetical protein [Caballeronia sp. LZ035]MDR5761546.1 hypothetical protein [Caballeronia sp. LZ035]
MKEGVVRSPEIAHCVKQVLTVALSRLFDLDHLKAPLIATADIQRQKRASARTLQRDSNANSHFMHALTGQNEAVQTPLAVK